MDPEEWRDDAWVQRCLAGINDQIATDHERLSRRNAERRRLAQQSPALQFSGLLGNKEPETDAEYNAATSQLAALLLKDPVVERYNNFLDAASPHAANTEWWHAWGHQQVVAINYCLALTRKEVEDPRNRINRTPHPIVWDARLFSPHADGTPLTISPAEAGWEWAGRALDAQTYLWRHDTLDAAVAAPLPEHIVQPNAVPFTDIFFSFEMAAWVEMSESTIKLDESMLDEAMRGGEPETIEARSETWWCLITTFAEAGMMIWFDKQIWPLEAGYQPQTHLIVEPVSWGQRWPQDFEHRRFKQEIGSILRMLAFMQAPFVDASMSSRRLPRPFRRDYERKGRPAPPEKACSVITLRRALNEPVYRNGDESGPGRDYKHSWWVSGHYRWQYFPSEKTHRLIAIAPYMKQIGKPLLRKLYDVAR